MCPGRPAGVSTKGSFVSDSISPLRKKEKEKAKQSNARLWLGLSLGLTALITAWAFSMPFRSGGLSFTDKEDVVSVSSQGHGGARADTPVPFDDADSFRAAALAMDAEYMRTRREKERLREVPGKVEVRRRWEQHVDRVRDQVKRLGKPEEGTLEWQERQELIESLEDAPL